MAVAREVFAGFTYLSSLESAEDKDREYKLLLSKINFIPDALRPWFEKYVNDYATYDKFPDIEILTDAFEQDVIPTFKESDQLYHKQLVLWESDVKSVTIPTLSLIDRRKLVNDLGTLLMSSGTEGIQVHSVKDVDMAKFFIKETAAVDDGVIFPTKRINSQLLFNPGTQISVLAGPGIGKTAFAMNVAYLNTFKRAFNVLYVYLENVESNYMAELLARHSRTIHMDIENRSLKAKVLPTDVKAVDTVNALVGKFKADMKGSIRFSPFTDFSTDPNRFGAMLGELSDKLELDIVILDYCQRCASFNTGRLDGNEYVNRVVSALASAALGAYGNRPFVSVCLSQLNREAMIKMEKTHSVSFTAFAGAGASSIERDAFGVVGIYSSAQTRSEGRCSIKILKARDGEADIEEDNQVPYIPQFCFMGDVDTGAGVTMEGVYDPSAMVDLFDTAGLIEI
jgi:hypothetical protein